MNPSDREKVLIVDDERNNVNVLVEILKPHYRTAVAIHGAEALKRARSNRPPDIILLDIMMPEMDGYAVCEALKADRATADIPVIFISAMADEADESKGLELGAVDFITKPIKPAIVKTRIKTRLELRRVQKKLAAQNEMLEQKVQDRTRELRQSRLEIVNRLVHAAEYRDTETASHITRMSRYSAALARAWGLDEGECEIVLVASKMHDIGKIGIPDQILLKEGGLEPAEWEVMKTHTEIGAGILSDSDSKILQAGHLIALSHHEKWDGSGYPRGLSGTDIPLYGRINAVSDVFDALTTRRPYKPAWTVKAAMTEIEAGKGRHFDPDLVDRFRDILPEILQIREDFSRGG
ncbi:MAG: HD-GYP domain-containing protein [Desulfococcaceae bacterium]